MAGERELSGVLKAFDKDASISQVAKLEWKIT
jgi:hypothetical protein